MRLTLLCITALSALGLAAPIADQLWPTHKILEDALNSAEYKFGKKIGLYGPNPPPLLDLKDPKHPKTAKNLNEATHYVEPYQGMNDNGKTKVDLHRVSY